MTDVLSESQIRRLHLRGDCYVSLCRGEGWGIGAFDAAAHGNPVVMTAFGGQLDYLKRELAYLVNYELVPVINPQAPLSYSPDQRWAEPDIQHGAQLLRHVRGASRRGELQRPWASERGAGALRRTRGHGGSDSGDGRGASVTTERAHEPSPADHPQPEAEDAAGQELAADPEQQVRTPGLPDRQAQPASTPLIPAGARPPRRRQERLLTPESLDSLQQTLAGDGGRSRRAENCQGVAAHRHGRRGSDGTGILSPQDRARRSSLHPGEDLPGTASRQSRDGGPGTR